MRIQFDGEFEGRSLVWDCEFVTLKEEYARLCSSSSSSTHSPIRCFIEIATVKDECASLRVGLNIPVINASSIEKMILMIRNYRFLRRGRHEFGETYPASKS